jgi:hypothetical protein
MQQNHSKYSRYWVTTRNLRIVSSTNVRKEKNPMRKVPDRFGWLIAFGGLVMILESLAALVWSVLAFFVPTPFFSNGHGVILVGTALLLGGAFLFSAKGFSARSRARRRVLALQGNQEAIPHANIPIDPDAAPDMVSTPLELRWRYYVGAGAETFLTSISVVFFCLTLPFWYLSWFRYSLPNWWAPSALPAIYRAGWFQAAGNAIILLDSILVVHSPSLM